MGLILLYIILKQSYKVYTYLGVATGLEVGI